MTELFATIYTVAVAVVFLAWLLAKFLLDLTAAGNQITTKPIDVQPRPCNRRRSLAPRVWRPVSTAHLRHAETLRLIWAPPVEVSIAPSPVLLYGRPPVDVEVLRVAA